MLAEADNAIRKKVQIKRKKKTVFIEGMATTLVLHLRAAYAAHVLSTS